jgi:hypothetical protein
MLVTLLLILSAVFYRVTLAFQGGADVNGWLNFAPMGALALCGARFLPGRMGFWVPLVALLASDLILNDWVYQVPLWSWELAPRYGALLLVAMLGRRLAIQEKGMGSLGALLGSALAGSLIFYAVTNTASWFVDAGYPKTGAGWVQALTTGLPGYPSTLWFYRNTLFSDVAFTLLFGLLMRYPGIFKQRVLSKTEEGLGYPV